MPIDEPSQWARALTDAIREVASPLITRVEVVAEASSTQDLAMTRCGGQPGLLLIALNQTAGRGRLGRAWTESAGTGVAATVVLSANRYAADTLSMAIGLAAAKALDGLVPARPRFGLRWPNDVVEPMRGGGRKISGVLVEIKNGLALVGIGINVLQKADDFPPEIRGSAVSLAQLGASVSRLEIADRLLRSVAFELGRNVADLPAEWTRRDVLAGTRQAFVHNGRRYEGMTESIDPAGSIRVRCDDGELISLPALTTSLCKP